MLLYSYLNEVEGEEEGDGTYWKDMDTTNSFPSPENRFTTSDCFGCQAYFAVKKFQRNWIMFVYGGHTNSGSLVYVNPCLEMLLK